MKYYNLMTLDAKRMIEYSVMRDPCKNWPTALFFDFTEETVQKIVIDNTDRHMDNALFFQIKKILLESGEADCPDPEDMLRKSLLYVDFKGVFSPAENKAALKKNDKNEEPVISDSKFDKTCERMFKYGLKIRYEDGDIRRYIPYEKSGSMSRRYKMTFLDERLQSLLEEKLRMGIDFDSLSVVLSKYYAYRGLYLTDGTRIAEDEEFVLNEKTVLVVEDDSFESEKREVLTADPNELKNHIFTTFRTDRQMRINPFDGEGLIMPDYAAYINTERRRQTAMRHEAASFQIRMPYVKGMVHEVDFQSFFRESLQGLYSDALYVYDYFGVRRKLSDVRILLTESMFKCAKWLAKHCENHPEITDPMQYYFENFHRYEHALYIGNTDANMGEKEISLNYQFLNTLALDGEKLQKLTAHHNQLTSRIFEGGERSAKEASELLISGKEPEADSDIRVAIPAWEVALSLNPGFVKDPLVRSRIYDEEAGRIKDICMGRLMTEGTLRFLSGDLLGLMIHVIKKVDAPRDLTGPIIRNLYSRALPKDYFYTADHKKHNLVNKKRYGILRNPHLSRNEQCVLLACVPDETAPQSVYDTYFSKLTSVIMLSYSSADACALGGADFDGDKVKLILDDMITDAIIGGAYEWNKNYLVRKFPIVDIPSLPGSSQSVPKTISYDMIRRTFSNQIGLISDLAIKLGKNEYTEGGKEPEISSAECTLATGLEIDAVKTGVRPNVTGIMGAAPGGRDYYLSCESRISELKPKDIRNLRITYVSGSKNTDAVSYLVEQRNIHGHKAYRELARVKLYKESAEVPSVDRLPGLFVREVMKAKKEKRKVFAAEDVPLFLCQTDTETGAYDKDWKKQIEEDSRWKEKEDRLLGIMLAYGKLQSDFSYLSREREKNRRASYMGRIWETVLLMYDAAVEGLPETGASVGDAIESTYTELLRILPSLDAVRAAKSRMKQHRWAFLKESGREKGLCAILETNELDEVTKELLLNNEPDGWKLLEYYLDELEREFESDMTIEQVPGNTVKRYKGFSEEAYCLFLEEYKKGEALKETKKLWNARVIKKCRELIGAKDLFDGNFDLALIYYLCLKWKGDPDGKFLWEVFSDGEILRNIYVVPESTGPEKAEA